MAVCGDSWEMTISVLENIYNRAHFLNTARHLDIRSIIPEPEVSGPGAQKYADWFQRSLSSSGLPGRALVVLILYVRHPIHTVYLSGHDLYDLRLPGQALSHRSRRGFLRHFDLRHSKRTAHTAHRIQAQFIKRREAGTVATHPFSFCRVMWPPPTSFALLALSGIASAMVIDGIPQHAHLKRQRTTAHPLVADSMSATTKGTSLALDQTPNRYVADITINDRQFRVVIDTGSTDLWVKTSADFAYNTTDATPLSLVYGDTATGAINGTTGFAAVSLGGYTVPQQAFMNATAGAFDGLLDVGLDGYLGLGFISESEINEVFPSDSTVGQPLLYNIFDMTPEQENFISFSLSRSDDLEGSAAARFTINELDETYAAVANEPKVPIFPENTVVWGVPVDGISIDGVNITLKSIVPGAPNGSLIAIMDTGTPGASLPPDILYALYSRIPGASVSVGDSEILFVIPCNTSSVVTVVVSGVPYPIHPLDLSEVLHINTDIISNSTAHANVTLCRGSIHASAPEQFQVADALFGDFFQRNVYTVMNYGGRAAKSVTGSASIQMLALTDPTKAVADVLNVRMAQLALVPEFHDLVDGFVPALPGSTLADVRGAGSIGNASAAGAVGAVADGGAAPSSDGSAVQKYALIVIGMLSGNLLLLILLALVVGLYIKRGRKSSSRASAYAPVKLREEEMLQGETYEVDHRYSD